MPGWEPGRKAKRVNPTITGGRETHKNMIQPDLFPELMERQNDVDRLWLELTSQAEVSRKTRKRLFAEIGDLSEAIIQLKADIEQLKSR